MAEKSKLMDEILKIRDELRLQMHLGAREAEDEWDELMQEWDKFLSRSQLDKSADEVGEAAKQLGMKMKEARSEERL